MHRLQGNCPIHRFPSSGAAGTKTRPSGAASRRRAHRRPGRLFATHDGVPGRLRRRRREHQDSRSSGISPGRSFLIPFFFRSTSLCAGLPTPHRLRPQVSPEARQETSGRPFRRGRETRAEQGSGEPRRTGGLSRQILDLHPAAAHHAALDISEWARGNSWWLRGLASSPSFDAASLRRGSDPRTLMLRACAGSHAAVCENHLKVRTSLCYV